MKVATLMASPLANGEVYSRTSVVNAVRDLSALICTLRAISQSSRSTITGSFTLPAAAAGTTTRMRVSMRYNSYPSACGNFSYGEVEDYNVAIE